MAEIIAGEAQHAMHNHKKKSTRGASFTPSEDTALAKAWISTSENAIDGAEQKGDEFMKKVQRLYNDHFKPANRDLHSFESVTNRIKLVLKQCTAFSACYARISRAKPSGSTSDDLFALGTALFNGVEMASVSEYCGKPFKFIEAWGVLRKHEKFKAGELNVQSKEGSSSSSDQREATSDDVEKKRDTATLVKEATRPVGRKRAKEEKRRAQYSQEKIKLAAQSVAAEVERNNVLKRHYEIMLFTSAPAGCDDAESLEYFKTMRARALNDIRKERKKSRQDDESYVVATATCPTEVQNGAVETDGPASPK